MKNNDDPRVLFAAERTLLAWQRSAVALMGFGFVIERFGLFVTLVLHEDAHKPVHRFSLGLGVVLLSLAALVALVSARQFRVVVKDLTADAVPNAYWTNIGVLMNLALALIAALLVAHLLWSGP